MKIFDFLVFGGSAHCRMCRTWIYYVWKIACLRDVGWIYFGLYMTYSQLHCKTIIKIFTLFRTKFNVSWWNTDDLMEYSLTISMAVTQNYFHFNFYIFSFFFKSQLGTGAVQLRCCRPSSVTLKNAGSKSGFIFF